MPHVYMHALNSFDMNDLARTSAFRDENDAIFSTKTYDNESRRHSELFLQASSSMLQASRSKGKLNKKSPKTPKSKDSNKSK